MTRAFRVPEVLQSSALDCGPAALKALLDGLGIPVEYGALREAAQTSLDGTSINQLEDIANSLGATAEQVLVPKYDFFLDDRNFTSMLVTRLPTGLAHFVAVWRRVGQFVQVMDPAAGRQWWSRRTVLDRMYEHEISVPPDDWVAWASGFEAAAVRAKRRRRTGLPAGPDTFEDWRGLAEEDCILRFLDELRSRGVVSRRSDIRLLHNALRACSARQTLEETIPPRFWSARSHPTDPQLVVVRGAILLRFDKPVIAAQSRDAKENVAPSFLSSAMRSLSPTLMGVLVLGLFSLGISNALELLLAPRFLQLTDIPTFHQWLRVAIVASTVGASLLALEYFTSSSLIGLGRTLERRFRDQLIERLRRTASQYFRSRLTSDMAERAHSVHHLRQHPFMIGQVGRNFITVGIGSLLACALVPEAWHVLTGSALLTIALPLMSYRLLLERDLRARSLAGALSRYYLDALLGLAAIRAHSARNAVCGEHERLLVRWGHASRSVARLFSAVEGLQLLIAIVLAYWTVTTYLQQGRDPGGALILALWSFALPALGQQISTHVKLLGADRNITARLRELLQAPTEPEQESRTFANKGIAITFEGVSVTASGHEIVQGIDARIPAGAHVAIVGTSGAGKSTLVGILLGWDVPSKGTVLVDELPLNATLESLRAATAWVDPSVYLWNASVFENVQYGSTTPESLLAAIRDAEIDRMRTRPTQSVGEAGRLLSGGEGQRLRLGRALMRPNAQLVILDEAFRGLPADERRRLLERCRNIWAKSTLLFVTHDLDVTADFDHVIVMHEGRILEQGTPKELLQHPESRYRILVEAADRTVLSGTWRTVSIDRAELQEFHR